MACPLDGIGPMGTLPMRTIITRPHLIRVGPEDRTGSGGIMDRWRNIVARRGETTVRQAASVTR